LRPKAALGGRLTKGERGYQVVRNLICSRPKLRNVTAYRGHLLAGAVVGFIGLLGLRSCYRLDELRLWITPRLQVSMGSGCGQMYLGVLQREADTSADRISFHSVTTFSYSGFRMEQESKWTPRWLSVRTQGQLYRSLMFPIWQVAVIASFLYCTWAYYRMRRRRRESLGRCGHCGYDLTGNVSGICPECGVPTQKGPEKDRKRCQRCQDGPENGTGSFIDEGVCAG